MIEEEGPLKKDRFDASLFCHYHNSRIPGKVYPETLKILNYLSDMIFIIRDSGRAIKKNCHMDGCVNGQKIIKFLYFQLVRGLVVTVKKTT